MDYNKDYSFRDGTHIVNVRKIMKSPRSKKQKHSVIPYVGIKKAYHIWSGGAQITYWSFYDSKESEILDTGRAIMVVKNGEYKFY